VLDWNEDGGRQASLLEALVDALKDAELTADRFSATGR
jgi:hypothetical protein